MPWAVGDTTPAIGTSPAPEKEIGGFCCPVPPGPRLPKLGLGSDAGVAREVVVGVYSLWPDNGGTTPNASQAFTTYVDPGSPPRFRWLAPEGNWWRRRVLPPGPFRLFHKAV